ncbi:cupredoxin domain-containing protein [Desulfobacterota bacterium AH_259_B03_O07]|nr:cupredoxin domain-containing protein [Desulfobacterota bacterium AH_259_B03_O07]
MSTLIINLIGIILIIFIVWWFWLAKRGKAALITGNSVDVVVDGGVYEPGIINTKVGKPITLRFIRKDSSPCAEKVIFSDLDISADLPIDKPFELTFTPDKLGEFDFTCQMAMYRGKLIVEQ